MTKDNKHRRVLSFMSSEYRQMINYVKRYFNEKYYHISAEDIIQDVALNIFSKLDFDEKVENMAAYIYRALKNKINDYRRKKRQEIPFQSFSRDEEKNSYIEKIFDFPYFNTPQIDDNVFYQKLNEALNQLSPNQQMVFIATEIDGYSFEELSQKLNIPVGTLLSWKHKGVQKLKNLIRPEEFYRQNY
ncbi:MAG: RNA polymerase sigma factor [Bacteroidota bacterium]|nr:RNA polymerase sigma factor [Bacteroidota bacterium]